MGVYCKTLRGHTKIVDGIEIGHYVFAYKCASDLYRGCRNRSVNAMHAIADRMADKNHHVRHFINCDFSYAEHHPIPVVRIDGEPPSDVTEGIGGETIGHLVKRNGRYHLEEPVNLV